MWHVFDNKGLSFFSYCSFMYFQLYNEYNLLPSRLVLESQVRLPMVSY